VENLARRIGTFEISTKPASGCAGAPPKARTRARLEEVQKAEQRLNAKGMIEKDLKNATVLVF
jgi:thiamine biosynthesis protein ThiI